MDNDEQKNNSVEGFKSTTIPQGRLLPGIHGLRGIAALAVVLFHLVHIADIAAPLSLGLIGRDFGKGVHLFFVLSAFSLMHSTEHTMHRPTWTTEYFIKRFFRIAPLYYTVMTGMVLWQFLTLHTWTVDFQTVLLNVTFTFGFAPWSGIVWAGWTVGVEMLFYAILPVLLLTVRTMSATVALVVISIFVTFAADSVLHVHYDYTISQYKFNWAYFSFPANLCFFAMGIYAFRVARQIPRVSLMMRWVIPAFSVVLLGALMFRGYYHQPKGLGHGILLLWSIGFVALCVWQSKRPNRWIANKVFEYLGERSYSVYLLHPVVIFLLKNPLQFIYGRLSQILGAYAFFVCAALAIVPLLILSEVTYRWIEVPGIRIGRRIIGGLRQRSENSIKLV